MTRKLTQEPYFRPTHSFFSLSNLLMLSLSLGRLNIMLIYMFKEFISLIGMIKFGWAAHFFSPLEIVVASLQWHVHSGLATLCESAYRRICI